MDIPPQLPAGHTGPTPTDREHLKLLAIFHRIVGVITCLIGSIPVIHLFVGVGLMAGGGLNAGFPGFLIGLVFVVFALLLLGGAWTLGICLITAGGYLQRMVKHRFCFVTAACACAFMPLGTALGVFSIIVLSRPAVKEAFGA